MYIHIYIYLPFFKNVPWWNVYLIYIYIYIYIYVCVCVYLLFLIQEMVHTTCTFHIKETTPLISCYIDSSWLLSSWKIVPIIYFFNPFFKRKSVAKENVYIFHIFEKIGTFFKMDVYIINTHVYIHYTTIDDIRPNAIIRRLQRIWIPSDRLIDLLFFNLYILYAFLIL